jgi:hypothetical protein
LTVLTSIVRSSQAERFRERKNKHRFKGIPSQFSGAESHPNSIVDNLKIVMAGRGSQKRTGVGHRPRCSITKVSVPPPPPLTTAERNRFRESGILYRFKVLSTGSQIITHHSQLHGASSLQSRSLTSVAICKETFLLTI